MLKYILLMLIHFIYFAYCTNEEEKSTFFGMTHEVFLSSTTLEIVDQMQALVFAQAKGDRRVRRYFDAYDTPFVGNAKKKSL